MENVLKELGVKKYFDAIIDSQVAGIEKPDPEIFQTALDILNVKASDAIVVGDSYERDIQPAKMLGCTTMWLDGKSWKRPLDTHEADYTIKSLFEIIIYT